MKLNIVLFTLIASFVSACDSTSPGKTFYDENNYNTVKEIKSFNNQLFILGQHFSKEGSIQHTTSLLCLDTLLNRVWDKHLGDVNAKEWFESFSINSKGEIFLAGYNEQSKSALLLKLNVKGETAWRKEYAAVHAFTNIEVYNDTALIVAATKKYPVQTWTQDSCFIQKLDPNGNVVWTRTASILNNPPGFLKMAKDKIIFFTNIGIDNNSPAPISKLICLDQSGNTDWVFNLTPTITEMTSGAKAINLKVAGNGQIYTLCQSNDMRSMALLTFDLTGQQGKTYQPELANLPTDKMNGKDDDILMFTGFNVDLYKKDPIQVIVKKDKQQQPYFAATATGNQLIDLVTINNSVYKIANTGDLGNHLSAWQVIKTSK
jgi:hypothetical protein